MKRRLLIYLALFLLASQSVLFAQPEQMEIESAARKAKKAEAKAAAKNIDLSKIEDKEAKAALEVLFSVLDLKTKK